MDRETAESLNNDLREATDSEVIFVYTVSRETFKNVTKHMNQTTVNFFLSELYKTLVAKNEENAEEESHPDGSQFESSTESSSGRIKEHESAFVRASCSAIRNAFDGIVACLGKGKIDKGPLVLKVLSRLEVDFPYLKYLKAAEEDSVLRLAGIEPNFQNLPKSLQQHALSFLGDAHDFLHCERTCKAIQDALKDDQTWQAGSNGFENTYNVTFREFACIVKAVGLARDFQKVESSRIVRTHLGSRQWEAIVRSLCTFGQGHYPAEENNVELLSECHHRFFLRGDSSAVLIELVEVSTIDLIRRATKHAAESCLAGYPELTRRDIISAGVPDPGDLTALAWTEDLLPIRLLHGRFLADEAARFRIVRRLAFSAGAIKIANDVYDFVWAIMIWQLHQLMNIASADAAVMNEIHQQGKLKKLFVGQQIRDIPPCSVLVGLCDCGSRIVHHTLVPRQIEMAAKRFPFSMHKVYGDPWIADGGSEEEMKERQEAEAQYEFVEYDDEDDEGYCEIDADSNMS